MWKLSWNQAIEFWSNMRWAVRTGTLAWNWISKSCTIGLENYQVTIKRDNKKILSHLASGLKRKKSPLTILPNRPIITHVWGSTYTSSMVKKIPDWYINLKKMMITLGYGIKTRVKPLWKNKSSSNFKHDPPDNILLKMN